MDGVKPGFEMYGIKPGFGINVCSKRPGVGA